MKMKILMKFMEMQKFKMKSQNSFYIKKKIKQYLILTIILNILEKKYIH